MKDRINKFVSIWKRRGYEHDIPDEACPYLEATELVPSYRRIVIAILKNDFALKSLGFARPQTEAYMTLKRAEIDERIRSGKTKNQESV